MKRVQGMLSIKRASGNIKNDNEPKIPFDPSSKPRGRWTGQYYIWMVGHELFQEMV